jgi:hypothetical protein
LKIKETSLNIDLKSHNFTIFRLIRGDGEIVEEPVSRARQKEINKSATQADGDFFQKTLAAKLK